MPWDIPTYSTIHEHYYSIHSSRVWGWKMSGSLGINECTFTSISDVAFPVCLGIDSSINLSCFCPKVQYFIVPEKELQRSQWK